jgi:hypothetical protein
MVRAKAIEAKKNKLRITKKAKELKQQEKLKARKMK